MGGVTLEIFETNLGKTRTKKITTEAYFSQCYVHSFIAGAFLWGDDHDWNSIHNDWKFILRDFGIPDKTLMISLIKDGTLVYGSSKIVNYADITKKLGTTLNLNKLKDI